MLPEGEEAYGLSEKVIEKAAADGVGLLLTVDCGVSNVPRRSSLPPQRGSRRSSSTTTTRPRSFPRRSPSSTPSSPGYPFRDLCGCAVASKVEWALRFSRSPFFGASVCLLNARPANETLVVEAVRLTNLVETDRITESFVPGLVPFEKTRLAAFVAEDEVARAGRARRRRGCSTRRSARTSPCPLSDLASADLASSCPALAGQEPAEDPAGVPEPAVIRPAAVRRSTPWRRPSSPSCWRGRKRAWRLRVARLDLVTLGTLADLMPLVDENRILVRQGLGLLRASERNGLRQVFRRKDLLGKRISTSDIAWQVSPLLNSAGRMGEPGTATRLFLAETAQEAEALVEQLFALDGAAQEHGGDRVEPHAGAGQGLPGADGRQVHPRARRAHPARHHRDHGLPAAGILQGPGHRHRGGRGDGGRAPSGATGSR